MKKYIEKYNDLLSTKYDEATQGEFKWIPPAVFLKNVKPYIQSHIDVLDIGVGTGQSSQAIIQQGANVTGIDISEKMLSLYLRMKCLMQIIVMELKKYPL